MEKISPNLDFSIAEGKALVVEEKTQKENEKKENNSVLESICHFWKRVGALSSPDLHGASHSLVAQSVGV